MKEKFLERLCRSVLPCDGGAGTLIRAEQRRAELFRDVRATATRKTKSTATDCRAACAAPDKVHYARDDRGGLNLMNGIMEARNGAR